MFCVFIPEEKLSRRFEITFTSGNLYTESVFTFCARAQKKPVVKTQIRKKVLQKSKQTNSKNEINDKLILLSPLKTFYPKALNLCRAMVGFLTCSFPEPSRLTNAKQWQRFPNFSLTPTLSEGECESGF